MMQKLLRIYAVSQTKRVFLVGGVVERTFPRIAGGSCLGRPGNLKMCRGNAHLPSIVGTQICITKSFHVDRPLKSQKPIYWHFGTIFVITHEPLKLKSTGKTFFDGTSFEVLKV